MKKIIALLIITGILLTGTMVYAEESTGSAVKTKVGSFKSLVGELKPQMETIKANRTKINELRQQATGLYKETKKKIKDLLKSKDEITQVQIEAIKQSVDILVADKKLLAGSKGDIFKESVDLLAAKRNKDPEAYKQALTDIITIQSERIDTLNKVIEDIKSIGVI